jgi:hypothetical protein
MLAYLIGPIDANGAIATVAVCGLVTITLTAWIAKRRSRVEINNDFELAKIKEADALQINMAQVQRARDVALAKYQQNLITSHSSTSEE